MRWVSFVVAAWVLLVVTQAHALDLVKDGHALTTIVVAADALPQVKFAAIELQDHIQKMTGVKLPIGVQPEPGTLPIFVGPSDYTRQAGITTEDLQPEGYKVIATDKYLALIGRDAQFPRYPQGHVNVNVRAELLAQWQAYTGQAWDLPWRNLYDPRNHSDELGFSIYDPTGTLFAVYEFLEQQGVRWYLPYHDYGTIIPRRKSISVAPQQVEHHPAFSRRLMWYSFANGDREGFLWFKRQKLGMSEMVWYGHGTSLITRYTKKTHPEYFAVIGGRRQNTGQASGTPRLAAPLRDAMVDFADKFFTRNPSMRFCPIGPSDGFINIDDQDVAAGFLHKERGPNGYMSDYVWTFINDVAKSVMTRHPDRLVMGLAYSGYQQLPEHITQFSPNLGVGYCQNRSLLVLPQSFEKNAKLREDWLKALPSGEFYIWEYYLFHREGSKLAGVPVLFTRLMQQDAQRLRGKSKGEFVECSWDQGKMASPALNHLSYYLQAKLYWNPDLDREALIDEYCRLFYGSAAEPMKAFFDYAETVWMRPGSRNVYQANSFLKPEDVPHYFKLLDEAKAAAGEGDEAKRIELMIEECQPMKQIFVYQDAMARGQAHAKAGESALAVEAFKAAVASAQNTHHKAEALLALGHVYRDQLQDLPSALTQYAQIADLAINRHQAIKWAGVMAATDVLRQLKRYDEATQMLGHYQSKHETDYWQFMMLRARGRIAQDQQQVQQAAAAYQQALQLPTVPQNLKDNVQKQLDQLQQP